MFSYEKIVYKKPQPNCIWRIEERIGRMSKVVFCLKRLNRSSLSSSQFATFNANCRGKISNSHWCIHKERKSDVTSYSESLHGVWNKNGKATHLSELPKGENLTSLAIEITVLEFGGRDYKKSYQVWSNIHRQKRICK